MDNETTTIKEDVELKIEREAKVTYKSFEELNEAFKQKHLQ